ncbi:hypothetical protein APT63_02760 [Pseudomonas sp. 22-AL-CL-001]|nr:hypothetical protein APT63_02760 [Pseudomonas monteilii]
MLSLVFKPLLQPALHVIAAISANVRKFTIRPVLTVQRDQFLPIMDMQNVAAQMFAYRVEASEVAIGGIECFSCVRQPTMNDLPCTSLTKYSYIDLVS